MLIFFHFVVALCVSQVALSSASATAKKGYSFNLQANAKVPPPLPFPVSPASDGAPLDIVVGVSGNAGTQNGVASDTATTITAPQFVWADYTGIVYFTDHTNSVIRAVDEKNNVITFAGTGSSGFDGDGKSATSTQLSRPRGLSGDRTRLIVCDTNNRRVRSISLTSYAYTVSTIAGTGTQGYSGDGSDATSAELWSPFATWVHESTKDVYFTELHKCTIRKISGADGKISTVVGKAGICDNDGDNLALNTALNLPRALTGNSAGVLYWTEFGSNIARKLVGGQVTTIAGGGDPTSLVDQGDNGPATAASLSRPTGIWVDKSANVYISEALGGVVRKITAGQISTVLGVPAARGPFTKVGVKNVVFNPRAVWGDERSTYKLYVCDTDNHRIVSADLPQPASVMNTYAGGGSTNPPATRSTVLIPSSSDVWKDPFGNLYFSTTSQDGIYKVDTDDNVVLFAGTGSEGDYTAEGTAATSSPLDDPRGLWGDHRGLVVADEDNNRVRRISWESNNPVYTVAGGGSGTTSGIAATQFLLNSPQDVTGDAAGNYYFVDNQKHILAKVDVNGILTILAGEYGIFPTGSFSNVQLSAPRRITSDNFGNIYFSETLTLLIDGANKAHTRFSKFNTNTNTLSVVLGGVPNAYTPDGVAAEGFAVTGFVYPTVDKYGNIIFSEPSVSIIRVIDVKSGRVHTIAGIAEQSGVSTEGVAPTATTINSPQGTWLDGAGNLFFLDNVNFRLRKVSNFQLPSSRRKLLEESKFTMNHNITRTAGYLRTNAI